jgi:hypothetical protein
VRRVASLLITTSTSNRSAGPCPFDPGLGRQGSGQADLANARRAAKDRPRIGKSTTESPERPGQGKSTVPRTLQCRPWQRRRSLTPRGPRPCAEQAAPGLQPDRASEKDVPGFGRFLKSSRSHEGLIQCGDLDAMVLWGLMRGLQIVGRLVHSDLDRASATQKHQLVGVAPRRYREQVPRDGTVPGPEKVHLGAEKAGRLRLKLRPGGNPGRRLQGLDPFSDLIRCAVKDLRLVESACSRKVGCGHGDSLPRSMG